jgi:hypothetical protein
MIAAHVMTFAAIAACGLLAAWVAYDLCTEIRASRTTRHGGTKNVGHYSQDR